MRSLPTLTVAVIGAVLALSAPVSAEAAGTYAFSNSITGFAPQSGFPGPEGVAVDPDGNVLVADTYNDKLERFSPSGSLVTTFGPQIVGGGQLSRPRQAVVDSLGRIDVSDSFNRRVIQLDSSGAFLHEFVAPSGFQIPRGIAVSSSGDVAVADPGLSDVLLFSSAGTFIRTLGDAGPGKLAQPEGVTFDPQGNVWVADDGNNRVVEFDAGNGAVLTSFGSAGSAPGQFASPIGIGLDSAGHVFVAQYSNGRVDEFDQQGTYLASIGSPGSGAGEFGAPVTLAVDPLTDDLYVADAGHNLVDRFAVQPTLPPPTIGKVANAEVKKGVVLVKLPAGTSANRARAMGLRGAAAGFIPLAEASQVPIGTTFDTTKGTVRLGTAAGAGKPIQNGDFTGGRFVLGQTRKNPLTTLSMSGGGLGSCGTIVPKGGARKRAVGAAKHRRRLFASVRGRFRSRGRNSDASVRGTQWTTTDTCAGTLTVVSQGSVVVRDFTLGKSRLVKAGHRYFARAPKRH